MEDDEYEMEQIDALEDEEAGRIEENCEREETREIVTAKERDTLNIFRRNTGWGRAGYTLLRITP